MSVLSSALALIGKGFNVFPTHEKTPVLNDWPNLATSDPDQVTEWFTGKYSWADGFGVCPKDVCVVLDIDVKKGKPGARSLKYLIDEHDLPKDTFMVKTPSGGLHLYYAYPSVPEDSYILSITDWKLGELKLEGVDIRGNKGQVVGPSDMNQYKIIKDLPLAELPDSLVELLPKSIPNIDGVSGLDDFVINVDATNGLVGYDKPALGGEIPEVIKLGERHSTLLSLTASWSRKITSVATAKELLKVAIGRCEHSDGDPITYEDYLPRLEDAYGKFEPVTGDQLQWMLDHLIYVKANNSVFDLSQPGNVAMLKMESAKNNFKNKKIWVETTLKSGEVKRRPYEALGAWLEHPDRQTASNVGYMPCDDKLYRCRVSGTLMVNTYRSPEVDHHEGPVEMKDVEPFLDLVDHLWQENANIMLDWCAHLVQRPHLKVHWAPLIVTSQEGMGKNMFFSIMAQALGPWNTSIINAALFSKTFNSFLVSNQLVLINEVHEINKKEREGMMSKMKNYITESAQSIERKGDNIFEAETFSNFIIFSNADDAVDIQEGSRRMFVHINSKSPRSPQWYHDIARWMANGGGQLVNLWLKERKLNEFSYTGYAPITEHKNTMVQANKSLVQFDIEEDIATKRSIFASDVITKDAWDYYVTKVLHKGQRVSHANEKYLRRTLFKTVKYDSPKKRRLIMQLRLPTVGDASDKHLVIESGVKIPMSVYTCRNHGEYDNYPRGALSEEFQKIFDAKGDNHLKGVT